jgi:transposase-like protein/IS1 family transposase
LSALPAPERKGPTVTCPKCSHENIKKFGTYGAAKIQRFRCRDCSATFSPAQPKPLGHHTTKLDDAERIVALLCEGVSIRAITRLTGVHKTTILSLLLTVGAKCAALFDERVQNLQPRYVQADEAWTFVQKKQKRLKSTDPEERGDQYLWVALDSETKLVMTYHVGKRDGLNAYTFVTDLNRRIRAAHRFQITTDGLEGYVPAIEEAFGADVDFAQLIKNYAQPSTDGPDWFRPSARVVSITTKEIIGQPKQERISTSHMERANLTWRMTLRRFTRLTNAFSKKLVNLEAAVAIMMAFYNFCRVHQTLRVTPAMEAGLTNRVWTVRDLLTASTTWERAA